MKFHLWLLSGLFLAFNAAAAEGALQDRVKKAVNAAGGAEKLPAHFAWKEEFVLGESGTPKPRTAILHPPDQWIQNGKNIAAGNADRSEKLYLASVWTLRPLLDPQSVLTALSAVEVDGKPAWGVKISREKQPDISLYFFEDSARLARIDWRTFTIVFAQWRECEGFHYPSEAFVRKSTGKPHVRTVFKSFIRVAPEALTWPE